MLKSSSRSVHAASVHLRCFSLLGPSPTYCMEIPLEKFVKKQLLSLHFSCHLGSAPVICVLTQMVFHEGRLFSGFFSRVSSWVETLLWFSNTVFTAAGGCGLLSCKQKGQTSPQPAGQTHTPAERAAPCGVCTLVVVAKGAVLCFPATGLSFTQRPAREGLGDFLSKGPFSWVYWLHLHSFWCKDALLMS